MSDVCITVVEISIGPLVAADRADTVIEWLLRTGVVELNPNRNELWQPSVYRPGPGVRTAVPSWQEPDYTLVNNGVDVIVERQLYHPLGAYRPAACPACARRLDEAVHETYAAPWLAGNEPDVRCPGCAVVHPLGDWPDSFQVGELAVSCHNWPPLADAFLIALGQRLGPRWRVVHEYY